MGTAIEFGHFDHLEDTLPRDQYRQRLHILLHIEEYERRRQMTRFAPFFSGSFGVTRAKVTHKEHCVTSGRSHATVLVPRLLLRVKVILFMLTYIGYF